MACKVLRMGLVAYEEALGIQEKLVQLRRAGRVPDILLLLQHPPVYTLGGGGKPENLLIGEEKLREAGVGLYRVPRGGDITYHGPGQIVGYPIFDLKHFGRDAHWYLRALEEVLIRTLWELGVTASRVAGLTGVWVGEDKVAAIGVRISNGWITSHGFALNVQTDLSYFNHIVPCGLRNKGVTSLSKLLGGEIQMGRVEDLIIRHFEKVFKISVGESSYGEVMGSVNL